MVLDKYTSEKYMDSHLKSCGYFKVVTNDLKSLGLRKNPHIYTYPINKWKYENKNRINRTNKDDGGIWVTRGLSNAKKLSKYMKDKYNRPTKIFLVYIGEKLYENSYRIKTNKVKLWKEVYPEEILDLIEETKKEIRKNRELQRIDRNIGKLFVGPGDSGMGDLFVGGMFSDNN